MAIVNTTFNMGGTYAPFERPPDNVALWSTIPRGLRGFATLNGSLDAKPVNDSQVLTFLATLPARFGYVFSEIQLRISQNRADDWIKSYQLNLQNYYQGNSISMSWMQALETTPLGSELGSQNQALDALPRGVMWAPSGAGIEIQIIARNITATVAAAGTVACYINFWEFDLEQIRKFPINTPMPVSAR